MRKPAAEGSLRNPYTFIHHSLRTDLFVESGFDRFSLSDAKTVGRAHPNGVVFVVLVVVCFRPHGKLAVHIQCRCFRPFSIISKCKDDKLARFCIFLLDYRIDVVIFAN
ncbi:MAG: hypothetical protein ACI36Z_00855 [Alloprevotella sp.]